jgi:hypothetical protein
MKTALWLIAAELAMVFGVLTLAGIAHADPSNGISDVAKVAWYLKGEGDVVLASQQNGMKVTHLTCTATSTPAVACSLVVNEARVGNFCSHGRFTIHGFTVNGQFSNPKRCHITPSGPPA